MRDVVYRPHYNRSATLVRHLTRAAELRAWYREQLVDVSWVGPTQRNALVRLAHYSTRIEGNPLTLSEVEALAQGKDLSVEEKAKREVLNYFAALRWIWQKSPVRIDEKGLLHLHELLTRGVLSRDQVGTYKNRPNAVFSQGRIIYKPPPPEAAPILTQALLRWLHSKETRAEDPVIVSAVAHHRLVSIHPFMDGNGRAARSLASWILYRRKFDTHHIFALDEFFETDRPRYYAEIQKVREGKQDLTSWLEYVGEGIVATLEKTRSRVQTLRVKPAAKRITLNRQQERILQILGEVPRMPGGELSRTMKLSRAGVSKLMRPLLAAGLVMKEGSTKAALYRLP